MSLIASQTLLSFLVKSGKQDVFSIFSSYILIYNIHNHSRKFKKTRNHKKDTILSLIPPCRNNHQFLVFFAIYTMPVGTVETEPIDLGTQFFFFKRSLLIALKEPTHISAFFLSPVYFGWRK